MFLGGVQGDQWREYHLFDFLFSQLGEAKIVLVWQAQKTFQNCMFVVMFVYTE